MNDKSPVLSQYLKSNKDILPPPAKTPEECIVGPTVDERMDGAPFWSARIACLSNNKRKRSEITSTGDTEKGAQNNEAALSSPSSFEHAVQIFLSSGCCVIPNVLPSSFVTTCKQKATSDLEFLQQEREHRLEEAIQSNQPHLLAAVQRGDFRELVDRDGGRRDVRFQMDRFPYCAPGLVYNPIVFPFVKELLGGGDDINLLYAGVMWATPQQPEPTSKNDDENNKQATCSQKWHGDGGHLFHHTHLPPHCINVFYPLVDLSLKNGTTEFQSGTHRLGHFDDADAARFGFSCQAGSAVLFDYRLKHRGLANLSLEARPILYLAYAKPFFRDAGNLRSGQSLLGLSSTARSPPWVSRILTGEPMAMGKGFTENHKDNGADDSKSTENANNSNSQAGPAPQTAETPPVVGSGERWVLFRMNVELGDDGEEPKVLVVHHGDVATEVSAQFCRANQLDDQFVAVLADTIQQQMDACLQQQQGQQSAS